MLHYFLTAIQMHLKVSLYLFLSINMSSILTVAIFELLAYAAFNLSWVKGTNVGFGFVITH